MSSLELEYTLAGRLQLLVIINLFFFFPHSLRRLQYPSLSVWLSSSSYLYLVYVVKCRRRIQRQSAAARIPMSTQTTQPHITEPGVIHHPLPQPVSNPYPAPLVDFAHAPSNAYSPPPGTHIHRSHHHPTLRRKQFHSIHPYVTVVFMTTECASQTVHAPLRNHKFCLLYK